MVAAVAAVTLVSACGSQLACTAVGCVSGISVIAPAVVAGHTVTALTICGVGSCRTDPVTDVPSGVLANISVPTSSLPPTHRVTVTVNVLDAAGAVLVTAHGQIALAESTPNGPNCGPVCYFNSVSVTSDGRLSIRDHNLPHLEVLTPGPA